MKKYIIASSHPEAGISNRLKCLFSVMRLAEDYNLEPLLCWMPSNFIVNADFSDIFDAKIKKLGHKALGLMIKDNKVKQCHVSEDLNDKNFNYFMFNDWRFITTPKDKLPKNFSKVFPNKDYVSIDLEYERIPLRIRKNFLEQINKIKLRPKLKSRIDDFSKKQNIANIVGVHIRRREFVIYVDGRGKVSSDTLFFKRMRELISKNPNIKFFLATDSLETHKRYIKEFGDRIIVYPKKNWNKYSLESTFESIIDLMLLAKTKHILGTYLSTYTEMAWWFGGCKAKVEIIGEEEHKRQVISNSENNYEVAGGIKNNIMNLLKNIKRKSKIVRFFLTKIMEFKVKYSKTV